MSFVLAVTLSRTKDQKHLKFLTAFEDQFLKNLWVKQTVELFLTPDIKKNYSWLSNFQWKFINLDDPETSSEAKTKYEEIAEKAIGMTESIKHGIVLLQIAKNATLPEVQFKAKQQSGNNFLKITLQFKYFEKATKVWKRNPLNFDVNK